MRTKSSFSITLLISLLTACSLIKPEEPPTVPVPSAIPTQTPLPTASTPLAVLVVPADMDPATSERYQKTVYELAQQSGWRFQVRNTFSAADTEPGLKIVIALPPDPGINALAAAAPGVQFLAINIPDATATNNVSVLASSNQVDIPAFVAGYTAALLSDDFRAGMILPKDDATAQQAARAFANGMAYYCGICSSFRLYLDQNGLAIRYPQFVEIPIDENPNRFGGWANYLVGSLKVDALYVYPNPKLAARQLFEALGQTGALIIGASTPDPKPVGWVMEVRQDEIKAIQKAWPDLTAGRGGQSVPSPLGLADVDPLLLTPGKQRLVELVLDGLQSGRIATGVSP